MFKNDIKYRYYFKLHIVDQYDSISNYWLEEYTSKAAKASLRDV